MLLLYPTLLFNSSNSFLRSINIKSFCNFGMFHNKKVIFLFSKSQHIFSHVLFCLLLFFLSSSLHFFIFHFILSLLNSHNIIFLNPRVKKKRLHYYGTDGVNFTLYSISLFTFNPTIIVFCNISHFIYLFIQPLSILH